MPEALYRPGDAIVLKPRSLASIDPEGAGEIVSVQPETRGAVRYRVRLENENFDRSIDPHDIDTDLSKARQRIKVEVLANKPASSWVNSKTIKVRK